MQNNNKIETILNNRSYKGTNFESLNQRIMDIAKNTPQSEFSSSIVKINNSVKILAIMVCFMVGIFAGFNLEVNAVSNDVIDYIYVEEEIV
jgi:hypothetical protein